MTNNPALSLKRRQWVFTIIGFTAIVSLLAFGMWLSDPNRKYSSAADRIAAKNDTLINYTARSSGVVSAEDAWIERSEQRMQQLERKNQALSQNLERMMRLLETNQTLNTDTQRTDITVPETTSQPDSTTQLDTDILAEEIAEASDTLDVADSLLNTQSTGITLPPPPSTAVTASTPISPQENITTTPVTYPINRASTFPVSGALNNGAASGPNLPPRPTTTLNPVVPNDTNVPNAAAASGTSIMMVSLSSPKAEEEELPNVNRWLSAGSFATAILMSGMDAPTGGASETNPLPVLLRLKDDGQLPNFFKSNISDCHIIGAGYGDIASERAKIRLETLSCVLKNGDILEVPVSGYIAGEDGKNGMRGRVVPRTGSLIAKSLLAGTLGGIGSAVGQQYQNLSTSPLGSVSTIDPNNIAQAGLARGTQNALEKLADFYLARANEIYPVIEIEANRIGEIILTSKVDLGGQILNNTRRYTR